VELAKEVLSKGCDPMVEVVVDFANVYEVRGLRHSPLDPFSTSRSQTLRTKKHTRKPSTKWQASHWTSTSCQRARVLFPAISVWIISGNYQARISSSCVVSLAPLFTREGAESFGGTTRYRKLRFEYVLFESRSGPFGFVGIDSVEAPSEKSVQVIRDTTRSYLESHPKHGKNTVHHHQIRVYKVRGEPSCSGYG